MYMFRIMEESPSIFHNFQPTKAMLKRCNADLHLRKHEFVKGKQNAYTFVRMYI